MSNKHKENDSYSQGSMWDMSAKFQQRQFKATKGWFEERQYGGQWQLPS